MSIFTHRRNEMLPDFIMTKERHYYVPRSILKNFENGRSVFALKKDDKGRIFPSNVDNLLCEKDFYTFSWDIDDESTDENYDYDKKAFNKLDSDIAPIIKGIVEQGSIDRIKTQQRETLSKFVAYQYARLPAIQKLARDLSRHERDAKQLQGLNLLDKGFMNQFVKTISERDLMLLKLTDDAECIISDSPVLWFLHDNIYFPISPNYCLCYKKSDVIVLDSKCINKLEYLVSFRFNIAKNENVLSSVYGNEYDSHLREVCNMLPRSHWTNILHGYLCYVNPPTNG